MSTITIPASLAMHARTATIYMLGCAGREVMDQTELREPELEGPLPRFDAMRGLLDTRPVEPDTAAHGDGAHTSAILDALQEHATTWASAAEIARREGEPAVASKCAADLADLERFASALRELDNREVA